MLAKFDPVGHRDFWLRSFLEYVTASDPGRISPTARPHYARLQTNRMIDAYLIALADEVRPTLEKLIVWMEAQPEPDRLIFSQKGHSEDAWGLAVFEWCQALGLCKWLSRAGQAERHLISALNADLQGVEQASPKNAAVTRARASCNGSSGERAATRLENLGGSWREASVRPGGPGSPLRAMGVPACRGRRNPRCHVC